MFDRVYRLNDPPGLKGHRCRIVDRPPPGHFPDGSTIYNTGEELVAVEFEDGRKMALRRDGVILADSRLGRQAIRNATLGLRDAGRERARRMRQSRRAVEADR